MILVKDLRTTLDDHHSTMGIHWRVLARSKYHLMRSEFRKITLDAVWHNRFEEGISEHREIYQKVVMIIQIAPTKAAEIAMILWREGNKI